MINEYQFDDIYIGMKESFKKTITLQMEDYFREITGDLNPLHYDDEFATGNGFRSHVSFGMLTASLYSSLAGVYLPGKYSLIHSLENLSFQNPVYAGDELLVSGEVVEKHDNLKLIIVKAKIVTEEKKLVSKAKMNIIVLK